MLTVSFSPHRTSNLRASNVALTQASLQPPLPLQRQSLLAPHSTQPGFGMDWSWLSGLLGRSKATPKPIAENVERPIPTPVDPQALQRQEEARQAQEAQATLLRAQELRLKEIEDTQHRGAAIVEYMTIMDRVHRGQPIEYPDTNNNTITTLMLCAPKEHAGKALYRTHRRAELDRYYYSVGPVIEDLEGVTGTAADRHQAFEQIDQEAQKITKPAVAVMVTQPTGVGYMFTIQPDTGDMKDSFVALQMVDEGQQPVNLSSNDQHNLMVTTVNALHHVMGEEMGLDRTYNPARPHQFDYNHFKDTRVEHGPFTKANLKGLSGAYRSNLGPYQIDP